MSWLAVYPGTFDPITNGHADILRRSLKIFDRVVVALADNVRKEPLFSIERAATHDHRRAGRATRASRSTPSRACWSTTSSGAAPGVVIRGLRALADFEYEFQLAHMNRHLAPEVETMFLMTSEESFYVSSSLVKEVALMGGDVSRMVPPAVVAALRAKNADKESGP